MNKIKLLGHIKDHQIRRILDVGSFDCSTIRKYRVLFPEGASVIGVDLQYFRQSDFVVGDVCALPFRSGVFDFAFLSNVLEHLDQPLEGLRNICFVLREKGLLYLETPSLYSACKFVGTNFWDDPSHKRPYTKEALRRLARYTGFETVYVEYSPSLLYSPDEAWWKRWLKAAGIPSPFVLSSLLRKVG